jgi:16S rRNA (adenine1518-N6/adenine1519-N6)-dimethyltransferase
MLTKKDRSGRPATHRPRKRFGQHFLEPAWARKVVDAASPGPTDVFLEIGPGRGALTTILAPRVAEVVAVEIDRDLAAALSARALPNVRAVTGDFLDVDLPTLLARDGAASKRGAIRAIGNLPYNVSSLILFRLLDVADEFSDATLMLQREVADRLLAPADTSEYGVLSVLTRIHADVARVLDLPPGAFRPPPKVRSAVVRLTFRTPLVDRGAQPAVVRLVRGVFQHRRKTLANALRGSRPDLDADRILDALAEAGVDGRRRPETLEVTEFRRLAECLPA